MEDVDEKGSVIARRSSDHGCGRYQCRCATRTRWRGDSPAVAAAAVGVRGGGFGRRRPRIPRAPALSAVPALCGGRRWRLGWAGGRRWRTAPLCRRWLIGRRIGGRGLLRRLIGAATAATATAAVAGSGSWSARRGDRSGSWSMSAMPRWRYGYGQRFLRRRSSVTADVLTRHVADRCDPPGVARRVF